MISSNGYELAEEVSGFIMRIHSARYSFALAFRRVHQQIVRTYAGSFEYGAPPHGGVATGIDRLSCFYRVKRPYERL